jgi:hypothetical protein
LIELKGSRRVNAEQKFVHIYVNAKMIPVGGGEFKYDIFDTL